MFSFLQRVFQSFEVHCTLKVVVCDWHQDHFNLSEFVRIC